MPSPLGIRSSLFATLLLAGCSAVALAQNPVNRIGRMIDDGQVVTLPGNVHPMARAEFDRGPVSAETPLEWMVLEIMPSAAQQAELDALVEAQHDPQSPLFHQWLTPDQYGARFGASAQDLARVSGWLKAHGFTVEEKPASGRQLIFSGTVGQVLDAFHTEIHRYQVNGVNHIANVQDPQIPAALAGVVGGIVSLHDFRRNSAIRSRTAVDATPQYTSGSTHYLFPADWATIYDLNSLYSAGTTGAGTSIAIVGRSNINLSDVAGFRSISGLPANAPTVILVGANPGLVSGDQDEATLDVEWSGAVAPSATVKFVVSASTSMTDGVDLSAQYIVNHATAPVVSNSYGSCEQDMGSTEMTFYNSLWQQAASEGISAFVSSGDAGAAGCYSGSDTSASGTAVNGLCSSPYSTCVGGTEFNEGADPSQYWSTANSSSYESALGYIPEEVWNESGSNGGSGLWASGGGASVYYSQPVWQKGVTGASASNGMRAVPDVAMAAAGHDGYVIEENGSYYVIAGTSAASPSFAGVMALVVQSSGGAGQGNANSGLYPLLNARKNPFHATPSGNNSVPGVAGFTASGAPYNLATGLGSVDGAVLVSSWGSGLSTTQKIDFALTPSATSGTVLAGKIATFTISVTESGTAKNAIALTAKAPAGVTVSLSAATILPGAKVTVTLAAGSTAAAGTQSITVAGMDASGTQTVGYALTVTPLPTLTLSAMARSLTLTQDSSGTESLAVVTGGSFSGSISFSVSGLPAGVTAAWSSNPIPSVSGASSKTETLTLEASFSAAAGSATLTVTAAGDGLTATQKVTLQVQAAPSIQLSASPAWVTVQSLATATVTVTAMQAGGLVVPAGAADSSISVASGLPKGFTASWSAPTVTSAGAVAWTLTLKGSSTAVASASTLSLTAKVTGKTGTVCSASLSLPMTVAASPSLTATAASTSLSLARGNSITDVISLAGNSSYSETVTLSVSGLPAGVTASWSSNPAMLTAGSGLTTLKLTASSAAAAGTSAITVTAIGNGLTASQKMNLAVVSK